MFFFCVFERSMQSDIFVSKADKESDSPSWKLHLKATWQPANLN